MNTIPTKKKPNESKDLLSLGSLCSSGIKSEAAIYIKPPAANGRIKGIAPCIRVEKKKASTPPITDTSCAKKLYARAFVLLKPPYTSTPKSPSS